MAPTLLAPAGILDVPTKSGGSPATVGEGRGADWWGWSAQRDLRRVSSLGPVRGCGRDVVSADGLVRLVRVGGVSRVWGVATCKSPWACPVCHQGWARRQVGDLVWGSSLHVGAGGGLEFATCTVPHAPGDSLASVWGRLDDRWQGMVGQRWWKQARAELGIVGVARTHEVGWTPEGGWGPHCHALVFAEEPWSEPVRAAIFKRIGEWFRRGREAKPAPSEPGVGTLPPPPPSDGPVEPEAPQEGSEKKKGDSPRLAAGAVGGPVQDAGATAQYMSGGPSKGGEGRLFRLVRDAPALWREYEQGSYGRHPLHWSPGLKERFGIVARPESKQLPAEHEVVGTMPGREWRGIVERREVGALRIAARNAVHQGA